MLQQILSHTPLYVWAILAFLIQRGVAASVTREQPLGRLAILPLAMLLLSLLDLNGKFGLGAATVAAWLASATLAALASWQWIGQDSIGAGSVAGSVRQRGSWLPLVLMLAIFVLKFSLAVLLAVRPEARHNLALALAASGLFGLFNGIFFGRLARAAAVLLPRAATA